MRLTIKAKLAATFGVVIALSTAAGGLAYWKLGALAEAQNEIIQPSKRVEALDELNSREVTEISTRQMQQTPRLGSHWRPEFIRFITKWSDEFVIVPDMSRILG